jgi:hypothetical protein
VPPGSIAAARRIALVNDLEPHRINFFLERTMNTAAFRISEESLPSLRHPVALAGSNMMCMQSSTLHAAVGIGIAVGIAVGVAVGVAVHKAPPKS